MIVARWILTVAGLTLAIYVAIFNLRVMLSRSRSATTTTSWIPLVGGVLGCIALLIAPSATLRALWWLPWLVDPGCVPGLLWSALASRSRR